MKRIWFLYLIVCALLFPRTGFSSKKYEEQLGFPEKPHGTAYRGFKPSLEIVQARTPNSKVFKTEEYIVHRIFSHPIHRINDQGKLEDIVDSCGCFNWQIDEYYSGYADGLFEEINVCGSSTNYIQVNDTYYYRGFVEFNTDAIPDTAAIDSVILTLNCIQWPVYNKDHDIWSIESQPSISQAMTVYNDAADGHCYISNYLGGTGWNVWNLGDSACVDMTNLLVQDWFAVGISGFYSASAYYLLYACGTGFIDVYEPTGVKEVKDTRYKPGGIRLSAHPNPFTKKVEIRYRIPEITKIENRNFPISQFPISLCIYDLSGKLVKSLPISNFQFPTSKVVWQGKDNDGKRVPTGTYFYQLKVGKKLLTKRMLLIR